MTHSIDVTVDPTIDMNKAMDISLFESHFIPNFIIGQQQINAIDGVPPNFFDEDLGVFYTIKQVCDFIVEDSINQYLNDEGILIDAYTCSGSTPLLSKLKRYLFREVLQPYNQALSFNSHIGKRFPKNKTDLWYFEILGLTFRTDFHGGTRPLKFDISAIDYKSWNEPYNLNPCLVKILELKDAYEATFDEKKMVLLRSKNVGMELDWNFKEPFLTCYRCDIKRRIGLWLLGHPHLWENTLSKKRAIPCCRCNSEPLFDPSIHN